MGKYVDFNGKLKEFGFYSYQEYLESPRWKDFKKKLFKKRFTDKSPECEFCRRRNVFLSLHHQTYKRIGNERFADVLILCNNCHIRVHNNCKKYGLSSATRRVKRKSKHYN